MIAILWQVVFSYATIIYQNDYLTIISFESFFFFFLYSLAIMPLPLMDAVNISSQSEACILIFLIISFKKQRL